MKGTAVSPLLAALLAPAIASAFVCGARHHHSSGLAHRTPAFVFSVPSKRGSVSVSSEASPSAPSSASSPAATDGTQALSEDWELDCYSRPVVDPATNKKLWEVLLTDASGSLRVCAPLPSNRVNSREVRAIVEAAVDASDVKPQTIRFFRGAMFNMISIALADVDGITIRPSRCCYRLVDWIDERMVEVYPKMPGYRLSMAVDGPASSFLDVRTPVKLPDALRGEKYAYVSLPLAEFLEGGSITSENVGAGRLCPIPEAKSLPADAFVQGVVILTPRAGALAKWLAGTEVASMRCDLRRRTLVMEADISTQYLVAKLNDVQREEGTAFEEGKDQLGGLHFVSVQVDGDDDEPAGFWLLRDLGGSGS
mmetsp:Transcript_14367/g.28699  ORF Transcript_14367/g.28699 Transcript_14367/m.28699 type:complete len:367 (+) Transcript_14367:108-1208(+)